ncbi:MAG TPA: glycosyltransferase family 2 protein [Thermoanaerobaculia bacterium]|nr:glycosyltransferase family 2 protein [Thermoanaerobaculia bacterium]
MTDVDVIVLDLDGGAMLEACLASIAAQTVQPRTVIVFDNGSQTPTRNATARSERNLGFARGANAAVKHASAPFVALINNDVVLDRDWLQTVREAMDPGTAAVQTILRTESGDVDGAGIDISNGTYRQTKGGNAWGVSATATLYRRELLHFDERFFAYYEDVELCARLQEGGWQTRVVQAIKATHKGSQSAKHVKARYLRTRNRYWVARLHPGIGSIKALLWEDGKLLLRGRSSLRGMIAGLCSRLS